VAQLVLSGVQLEPQRGDEIICNGVTYRVAPSGDDQQLWMYHDRDRTVYRIHCKERV
jgi:cation transport regulator ChaC